MRHSLVFVLALSSTPALAMPDDPPWDPPPSSTTREVCTELIAAKHQALLQQHIDLGSSTSPVHVVTANFCWQAYDRGRIHTGTASSSKSVAIRGETLTKYLALGAESIYGQAFSEAELDFVTLATKQRFAKGYIVAATPYGARAINYPLAAQWSNVGFARFLGNPIADQLATPNGGYSRLERGYLARTDDMGAWADLNQSNATVTIKQYVDWKFLGAMQQRTLAGENPVALRAQLGAHDNQMSSLSLKMPSQTSLYLFDDSALAGRYTRITGADNADIRVSILGSFMNDRPSSMLFVNHGSVSSRSSVAAIESQIGLALDLIPLQDLLDAALAGHDATGTMEWVGEPEVTMLPGSRAISISRVAYLDVDADCVGTCNADGDVLVEFTARPYLALDANNQLTVRVQFLEGGVSSLSCSGWGCSTRDEALAEIDISTRVEHTFADVFDFLLSGYSGMGNTCPGFGVRRLNVLPDSFEIVLGDTAAVATCAKPIKPGLDYGRYAGTLTNYYEDNWGVAPFDGAITVVPDFSLPNPPPVKK